MDYIERSDYTGKRHAIVRRFEHGRAQTWCGKIMVGRTGGCIASLIDCSTCKAMMRKEGYTI